MLACFIPSGDSYYDGAVNRRVERDQALKSVCIHRVRFLATFQQTAP